MSLQKLKVPALLLLSALYISSCEMIEYSPQEVRLKDSEKNLNQKSAQQIADKLSSRPDTFSFLFISDTQRFYNETDALIDAVSQHTDIDFVLHGGDLTDFGILQEYQWQHKILKRLPAPYMVVIGNHDCLGNGVKVFENMYGPQDAVYNFGNSRFVFINTNSLEFEEDPVPRLPFLANAFGDTATYKNAFVLMHVPPFDNEFDRSKEEDFAAMLRGKKVRLALHGHQHSFKEQQPYDDGITYLAADDMSDKNYIKVEVKGTEVTYQRFHF